MNRPCIVIPTYNNAATIAQVAGDAVATGLPVIVVADGCTDGTVAALEPLKGRVVLLQYQPNRGKGHALAVGIARASELGYTHAITMDGDAQHKSSDIPKFLEAIEKHPRDIILGARSLTAENMPGRNTFANRFSNFWFALHTWKTPGDTQTGYRAYPLHRPLHFYTSRYEAELAVLVDAAWRGTGIGSIAVDVHYPPAHERVSHFKPARDFARISLLNTLLTFLAFTVGYPSMLIHKILKR